jgi:hypothetical protein
MTLLDDAVRKHFVSEYVVDTEASVRAERQRLLDLRSGEADIVRDEVRQVEEDLTKVKALARKVQLDYEAGDLSLGRTPRRSISTSASRLGVRQLRDASETDCRLSRGQCPSSNSTFSWIDSALPAA